MQTALRRALFTLLLTMAAALACVATALQPEPSVALQADPDADDVARAWQLLRMHDPRHTAPGMVNTVQLNEREIDLLLNHAAARWLAASSQVSLEPGAATLRSSVHLPPHALNPFGRWLNVQARWEQTAALPVLAAVRVGGLPLPGWLGRALGLRLAARAGALQELELAAGVVQRVGFQNQQLWLQYAWLPESTQRLAAALLGPEDLARLRAYQQRLATLTATAAAGPGNRLSLAPLMGPLFVLAQQRSGSDAALAAAENRAALVVLTLYANGRDIDALSPAANSWPRPRRLTLTLAGRDDFPLHLLISAALAAEGTGPLSRAIGIYKEVADSRGGSGFSFNDIAADRAGTRLGEMAVSRPLALQAALARGVQEADFMPSAADLPEFMPEPEFKRRFGGVGAPPYVAMLADIDRRVAALPVLR